MPKPIEERSLDQFTESLRYAAGAFLESAPPDPLNYQSRGSKREREAGREGRHKAEKKLRLR